MAINDINDADIREYILGQSGAAKTELLDELSFSDENSERVGAVEREIIDQYLAGQLSPDEKLAFESHYLSTPIRRERVDFARAFEDYSRDRARVASGHGSEGSIFDVFRTWRLAFQFGAAALVILIGIVGWLVFRSASPTEIAQGNFANVVPEEATNALVEPTHAPIPESSVAPSSPTRTSENGSSPVRPVFTPTPRPRKPIERRSSIAFFLLTPALRSSSFQQLKMPAGATTAEFRLQLETEEKGPYRVEVVDLRGRARVWTAQNLTARKGGSGAKVSFRIPVRVLGAGEHQITVSRAKTDEDLEKIGDYFFRVAP